MKKTCTLCGCSYEALYTFKAGHVCENCIRLLKSDFGSDTHVRTNNRF